MIPGGNGKAVWAVSFAGHVPICVGRLRKAGYYRAVG